MTKARDISKLLSTANGKIAGENLDVSFENITDTGTEGTRVATGTTAQRGTTAGQLRFNSTTGVAEYFNGANFVNIEGTPSVTSISPSSIQTSVNPLPQNITITGVNFVSGATVKFKDSLAVEVNSPSVSYTNSTTLVASVPNTLDLTQTPYDVIVTNPTGLIATLSDALQLDASPSWSTASGNIGTINDIASASLSVSASDPDGGAVTYSETGGTVLTTAGLTLNSSTGAITGTPNQIVTSSETKTFTLRATDNENNTTDRIFNIIITQGRDGSSTTRKAFSAKDLSDLNVGSGTKYVDINGVTVQMYYDNTDKFGNGVYGWLRWDNAFRQTYGSLLDPADYSIGTGTAGYWQNSYTGWHLGTNIIDTSVNGIGHVRMRVPRLQYAVPYTITATNSGQQTADDANVETNGEYVSPSATNGHVEYSINRNPQLVNPSGYPIAIYNLNRSNAYDETNLSVGSTGNLIYPYQGGLFSTAGTFTKNWTNGDFRIAYFSTFDSSGEMWMSSWSGDCADENIDYTNVELWFH